MCRIDTLKNCHFQTHRGEEVIKTVFSGLRLEVKCEPAEKEKRGRVEWRGGAAVKASASRSVLTWDGCN